mgnify:CR=1 FL=1
MSKFQIIISAFLISLFVSCTQNESPTFEWSFSDKIELIYSYKQSSYAKQSQNVSDIEKENEFLMEGDLALMVNKKGNADLELRNIKSSMWLPGSVDTMVNRAENNIIAKGLQSNGKAEDPQQIGSEIFEFFFTLPDTAIKVGESISRVTFFPFNTPSGVFQVDGVKQVTLKEIKEIDGKNIAIIESSIYANHLEIPPSMRKEYECTVTGSTLFYFDLDKQYFTYGIIDLNVKLTNHLFTETEQITTTTDSKISYELALTNVVNKE